MTMFKGETAQMAIERLETEVQQLNRQIEGMKIRLKQIVQSEDTTRMTAEQTLMGYNAHKDLARAALSEAQYPGKQSPEVGVFCLDHRRVMTNGICPMDQQQ